MSIARISSAQVQLLDAKEVVVEVDISQGLHSFSVVGLPDKAVEEAKDRVSAAVKNSGYTSPKQQNHKVVVSLAPAQLKKEGSVFDLAIALGYLLADEAIDFSPSRRLFAGELALDGRVRPVTGALSLARFAHRQGFRELFLPRENAPEAALIEGVTVYPVESLSQLIEHLGAAEPLLETARPPELSGPAVDTSGGDLSDIQGQETAKRALEIAATGGHNLAMSGPPGTGKTMLAKAFRGLLPPPSFAEQLETTAIHSAAGKITGTLLSERPFRSPHHSSSHTALIGGGVIPKPGEITLAHLGVLFLDEFPEFDRRVIESLRQPLEDRVVSIARTAGQAEFPADFLLVVSLNPCPCGYYGVEGKTCRCAPGQLHRYRRRLSGPIVDRIDLWTSVAEVDHHRLRDYSTAREDSRTVRERVRAARERAAERFAKHQLSHRHNSELSSWEIMEQSGLSEEAKQSLADVAKYYDFSARSFYKVAKVARTIADLDASAEVSREHIMEAAQYRPQQQI